MDRLAKPLVPVLLVALLVLAWFTNISGFAQTRLDRANHAQAAEQDVESGLYALAISEYKESLAYGSKDDIYNRISEVYIKYYEEEHTPDVFESYLDDMVEAARACPKNPLFYEVACRLYIESQEYRQAHDLVHEALARGTKSGELESLAQKLDNMTRVGSHAYAAVHTSLNSYMSVADGSEWSVLDSTGKTLREGYRLIGILNDDGYGIYVNDIDARLLDASGLVLKRFDIQINDVGCYDDKTHLVPVKQGNAWHYLNTETGAVDFGPYERAGAFREGKAAVCEDGQWYLINENAEHVSEAFADIKLDTGGFWTSGDVVVAKQGDKYQLFDEDLQIRGESSYADMGACVGDGPIACANEDGKWGFIDHNGQTILEPSFPSAKSFSNGKAAVMNDDSLWGFINESGDVVDEYKYSDAFYFNSDNKAVVLTAADSYQLLGLMFD